VKGSESSVLFWIGATLRLGRVTELELSNKLPAIAPGSNSANKSKVMKKTPPLWINSGYNRRKSTQRVLITEQELKTIKILGFPNQKFQ